MRDFKKDHAARQQTKKRIPIEIDLDKYKTLTPDEQKYLAALLRYTAREFVDIHKKFG